MSTSRSRIDVSGQLRTKVDTATVSSKRNTWYKAAGQATHRVIDACTKIGTARNVTPSSKSDEACGPQSEVRTKKYEHV
eukprot:2376336-Amphidinium_carterae.2